MYNSTLKPLGVTNTFEIISVDTHSPKYDLYMEVVEDVFRNYPLQMFAAIGFVCYVGFQRPNVRAVPAHSWFDGYEFTMAERGVRSLSEAEKILSHVCTGTIWKTHLKGLQHDYHFYSRADIEEVLDLAEVAHIMVS